MSPSELGAAAAAGSGLGHWVRSFGLMLRWELLSLRLVLPLAIVVQIMLGAGLIIGFGFLIGDPPPAEALYLSTGLTVVSMITIGLVLAPQLIAQQKMAGLLDYVLSLPVPRTTTIAAGLVANSLIAFPGMIVALLAAAWRFDLSFDVQPVVVPAALLTLISAASIGYAMAYAIPNPMITGLVTQVLVFVILLFSPINFPPERLPLWLQRIHDWLPFEHAANAMRAGLAPELATNSGRSFVVLTIWAVGAWIVTAWVVGRRE